jgi:hypothetical protein
MMLQHLPYALSFVIQIDPVSPSFDGPGAAAMRKLAGELFGDVLIGGIIAILLSAGLIIFGHFAEHGRMRKAGIVGVISGAAGIAIAAAAPQIVTWGQSIQIFN